VVCCGTARRQQNAHHHRTVDTRQPERNSQILPLHGWRYETVTFARTFNLRHRIGSHHCGLPLLAFCRDFEMHCAEGQRRRGRTQNS